MKQSPVPSPLSWPLSPGNTTGLAGEQPGDSPGCVATLQSRTSPPKLTCPFFFPWDWVQWVNQDRLRPGNSGCDMLGAALGPPELLAAEPVAQQPFAGVGKFAGDWSFRKGLLDGVCGQPKVDQSASQRSLFCCFCCAHVQITQKHGLTKKTWTVWNRGADRAHVHASVSYLEDAQIGKANVSIALR